MTDSSRIRELMLVNLFAVFMEDVIWTDADGTTHGHEAMNERAKNLLDGNPDFVFTAAGQIHVSRDLGHLAFNVGVMTPPLVSIRCW
jgi:hypothetical protein